MKRLENEGCILHVAWGEEQRHENVSVNMWTRRSRIGQEMRRICGAQPYLCAERAES